MAWARWIIVVLAFLNAGFMTVDGARALKTGDYFTPSSGQYAGQLGPWTKVVRAVGFAPRSTGMKTFFVIYGLIWTAVIVAFALKQQWSWFLMLVLAVGSAWYLIVGTVISILVAAMLFIPAVYEVYRP